MEKTITRRKFITYCGMSAAAIAAYTTLPGIFTGCSTSGFGIDKFMKMSALLTGFDKDSGLDEKLGNIYLESLEQYPPSKTTLSELYETLGVDSNTSETVELTDDQEKLAAAVITCWYTGNYTTADGLKSATYEDMLAWKATEYVTPNAQCHGVMGFWADAPKGVTS